MTRKPKICFILPPAYTLFNPVYKGPFGGWEVRISLIARELAKRRNFDVTILVGDYGQPHIEVIDNVRLISWLGRRLWGVPLKGWTPFPKKSMLYYLYDGIQRRIQENIHRFIPGETLAQIGKYRITKKNIAIYDEIKADIYVVPGNTFFSAEVAYYCIRKRKKYVFLAGSDMDYYPEYKTNPGGSDIYNTPHSLKLYSIEKAHAHVVQNERQAEMLCEGYGRSSVVIKNPINIRQEFPRNPDPQMVLWVGKSDERVKRPSVPLELAKRMPEFQFVMIMNQASLHTHMESYRKANELPNVKIIEQVPFEEIESYFANAYIHLNTSSFEGFPNTYLQAAKYGVPTITMNIDPGSMLSLHNCGLISGEQIDQLEADIRKLMRDDNLYAVLSEKSLRYVRKFHAKEIIIQKYENVLNMVMDKGRVTAQA